MVSSVDQSDWPTRAPPHAPNVRYGEPLVPPPARTADRDQLESEARGPPRLAPAVAVAIGFHASCYRPTRAEPSEKEARATAALPACGVDVARLPNGHQLGARERQQELAKSARLLCSFVHAPPPRRRREATGVARAGSLELRATFVWLL